MSCQNFGFFQHILALFETFNSIFLFLTVFELLKEGEVLVVPTDNPMSEKEAWLALRDVVHGLEYRKDFTQQPSTQVFHNEVKNFRNGILLPKLFWPTVRKNCSSDREKLLKFEAKG